jgi:hypothetical protein
MRLSLVVLIAVAAALTPPALDSARAQSAAAPATAPAAAPATAAAARQGTIAGRVLDRATRSPVPQATVNVEGLPLGAVTDDEGRFAIARVPLGTHRVRAWRLDYPAVIRTDVVVSAGHTTQTDFDLEARAVETGEVEVQASAFARAADKANSTYDLDYEEIRRSPGAIGDVSRLVQSLPGVINANDQRNDIISRGGSPTENLTLVDNVEVPNLNHFAAQGTSGGPISMLNNEFVRDASFLAGGFAAPYGDRLSSVMDIRLREGNRERFDAEFDVSFAGAGLLAEGPLGRHGSWTGSVRQSYLKLLAGPFGLEAIPYTTNAQAKAEYEIGTRDRVWAVGIWGRDNISFDVDASDLEDPSLQETDANGWRYAAGLNWQRLFGTRGWGTLAITDGASYYGAKVRDLQLGGATVFENRSNEAATTLKYDLAYRFGAPGALKAGASVKWYRNDYDIAQPYGTQDPFSTDTARVNAGTITRDYVTPAYGAYAQWTLPLGRVADLTLGGRADHYDYVDASRFSPRAGLTVHVRPNLDLNASVGRYHQLPAFVYLDAAPGNRELAPMRSDHYVAGVAWYPMSDLKVTVEGYQKDYADYPVAVDYPTLSLANTGDVYGIYGLLFPMTSAGEGRARGIEFYAQKKLARSLYGQLSYTYSQVRHAALDGIERRGGFDTPHTATVIAGYKLGAAWEFSSRFSYATGRPYTPPLEPASTQQNRYVLDLDRINALRSPDYSRLDLRTDYRFRFAGTNVTTFLEVQNVLDHENVFQYVWNPKTNQLEAQDQIRFLPILGVNVEL